MPATSFSFGDVVLVPFPFTNQNGSKKRPAVVVSSAAYNRARIDLVLMAITSQVRPRLGFGEVLVQDWKGASLLFPGVIKPVLFTIEKTLVIKPLGHLSARDRTALQAEIQKILSP